MLKLLDVFSPPQGPDGTRDLLASLDVTDNTEAERAAVLQNTLDLYGSECAYYWHECGHDEGTRCTRYAAA